MDAQPRPSRIINGAAAALLLIASAPAQVSAQQPGAAVDTRERIVLPAPARNMVLAEMRVMLESVSGVVAALSEGDMAAAAQAARASGMAAAVDVDPAVRALLPAAFVELGMATHQGFDALADQLGQPVDQRTAFAGLAGLMQNCVACHATYRADEAP
jgi:hypothetical protein